MRDWQAIQALSCAVKRSPVFATLPTPEFEREQLRDWDFGELPEVVSFCPQWDSVARLSGIDCRNGRYLGAASTGLADASGKQRLVRVYDG
ncbi:MAG: hypothetical protein IPL99_15455 [Candidatus Competibacteraceae bacterium]|nr:hypothetical protein [Candidatus Competibacteraceae bacterium]